MNAYVESVIEYVKKKLKRKLKKLQKNLRVVKVTNKKTEDRELICSP